jgi:thiosulfate dehydrogenase
MKAPRIAIIAALVSLVLLAMGTALAAESTPSPEDLIRGAQLYDKWFAVLGVSPPAGNMPIWDRQTTNTRSGPDTWRCSECHGWDYRGAQGEYAAGSHFTGFPDLFSLMPTLQEQDIVGHLNGELDPAHNFSPYLDDTSISQLSSFLKYGLIDDAQYIDPVTLKVLNADITHGQQLYTSTCTTCHGEDGKKVAINIEGITETLGGVANRDPWRFLHRTRFGVAGVDMPVGMKLGWTPEDGRDALAYAQALPTGGTIISEPTRNPAITPIPQLGGPARNIWTGILTSLRIIATMLFGSAVFIGVFIFIALIVVTIFRGRRKRNL